MQLKKTHICIIVRLYPCFTHSAHTARSATICVSTRQIMFESTEFWQDSVLTSVTGLHLENAFSPIPIWRHLSIWRFFKVHWSKSNGELFKIAVYTIHTHRKQYFDKTYPSKCSLPSLSNATHAPENHYACLSTGLRINRVCNVYAKILADDAHTQISNIYVVLCTTLFYSIKYIYIIFGRVYERLWESQYPIFPEKHLSRYAKFRRKPMKNAWEKRRRYLVK